MATLSKKVALVTGGGRGIGRSIALRYAAEGAEVAVTGRTSDEVEATAAAARELGVRAVALVGDQSQEEDARRMVEQAEHQLGPLDILVNNAAVGMRYIDDPELRWAHTMRIEDWDAIVAIDLRGVFLVTRFALPGMRERDRGSIVMISSGLGRRGGRQYGPYCASKFAMEGLMQVIAVENRDTGVRCNSLAPGGLTNSSEQFLGKMPADRLAEILPPNVCDDSSLYLASDAAAEVNGEALTATDWNAEHDITVEELRERERSARP
jgi:3-oxoacyl-[acyl-carrier protein] reductase